MSREVGERRARLVLVDARGRVMGQLPEVVPERPFWSDAESLVQAVREAHGIDVTVVRLLEVQGGVFMRGGLVTYLAETDQEVDCAPCDRVLDAQPLRAAYAEIGGARADVRWAEAALGRHGLVPTEPAIQVRTWNLSSLWRIPVGTEQVWLKSVPAFFAHEGALIAAMAPHRGVPRLLAHEPGRILMRELPGADLYRAPLEPRLKMIELLVELQRTWLGRIDALISLGLPDWRDERLVDAIAAVIERRGDALSAEDTSVLARFAAELPGRMRQVRDCGLPDTLVHGDFHPGNLRGDAESMVLLDWGDASVGHPLLDHAAFMFGVADDDARALRAHWVRLWREALPASDPDRAWTLLEPVAPARAAAMYQFLLDHIEPSERPYHQDDPVSALRRTAGLLRREA